MMVTDEPAQLRAYVYRGYPVIVGEVVPIWHSLTRIDFEGRVWMVLCRVFLQK